MTRYTTIAAIAVTAIVHIPSAHAQTSNPAWSVSFDLGTQLAVTGNVHGGGSGTVLNLPTQVSEKSYGDIYGPGFYWAAGLGRFFGERHELRAQVTYTTNDANLVRVGDVAGFPLLARFDRYSAFGMDVGYRHYLTTSRVRPFVGATGGFVNVDRIRSTFTVPAANVTLSDVAFYDSSTVPTVGVGGGLLYRLSDRLALQGGVDLRWLGDLSDEDGLRGTGLERINDESRRWTAPVTLGVTVRF